jgi:hypothetical protein
VLAEAPKDRTADYIVGAKDHPAHAAVVQEMTSAPLGTKLANVRDGCSRCRNERSSCGEEISARSNAGVDALLALFRELGVPEDLVTATRAAVAPTQESITLMVPLVWLAVSFS